MGQQPGGNPRAGKQLHAVARLPLETYNETVQLILAGNTSRNISEWLAERGHKISHAAVCAFTRNVVKPAQSVSARIAHTERHITTTGVISPETAKLNYQTLTKKLVASRLEKKYARFDKWLEIADKKGDIGTGLDVDRAETQALSLHADISGLRSNTVVSAVNMIVVLPGTESSTGTAVEDAEII